MNLRTSTLVALAAALAAAMVVAGPAVGKNKPPRTGEGCKPKVSLILRGTVAAAPGADSFLMSVTRANRARAALVTSTQLTISVNGDTKIRRQGVKTSLTTSGIVAGDRVKVVYRVCKDDVAGLTPASFTAGATMFAKRVRALPAQTT